MFFEPVRQIGQSSHSMVMADRSSCCLPNVLLWIEIWRSCWELDQLQARIRIQNLTNRLAGVPRCPVPQKGNGYLRDSFQNLLQMACGCFGIHLFRAHRDDLSGVQIQCTIEVDLLPSRVCTDNRCLTARRPHGHCRSLQVDSSFILRREHGLGFFLDDVYRFFSSCSSNSAILASERDLYTLAGR